MEIIVKKLSKSYGSLSVLSEVSLELKGAECYGLMGPSGIGKTTFLRLLMGLERPDSGCIIYGEYGTKRPDISAVFQEDRLCGQFSAFENIRMAVGRSRTDEEIKREMQRILPEEALIKPVSELSGGMKRRTAILRALLAPSALLIMDEPFTGLDRELKGEVIRYVRKMQQGRTLILATHQEEEIDLLGGKVIRLEDT